MPTTLLPGNNIKVRTWCTSGDQAAVNTIYYQVLTATGQPVTDKNVADRFSEGTAPFYKALLAATATYNGCTVQEVAKPTPQAAIANTLAGPGISGAVGCPRQICGIIRFGTPFAGKQYTGRNYIPFPASSELQGDGLMLAAYQTLLSQLTQQLSITTSFGNLATAPTGTITVAQVLFHSVPKGGTPPPPPPSQITTWSVSNRWATQRRRGQFGRTNISPI